MTLLKQLLSKKNTFTCKDPYQSLSSQELITKICNIQHYFTEQCLPSSVGLQVMPNVDFIVMFLSLIGLGKKVCLVSEDTSTETLKKFGIENLITDNFESKTSKSIRKNLELIDKSSSASTLIFTSGSTSFPKLISSSIKSHIISAKNAIAALSLNKNSKYLISLPLNHVSGIAPIFRCLLAGSTLIIDYSFNKTPIECLHKHSVSHVSCVSTQLKRLLQEDKPLTALKAILVGGSHISSYLIEQAYKKKLPIFLSYGLTESNSMICCNNVLKTQNFSSCGPPFDNVKISLSKDSRVCISSEVLFEEYILENHKTQKRPSPFITSDIGYLDNNNYLSISHRCDNIFISGGYNINPKDIEKVFEALDEIEKVCVLPFEHSEFGLVPVAFYFTKVPLKEKSLLDLLKKHLKFYQIPKELIPWNFNDLSSSKVTLKEKKRMLNHLQNIYK